MKLAVNVNLAKSIYLDERGDRNPQVKSNLDYFFIGGVEVFNHDKVAIVEFVRRFKLELYPEHDPSNWELKGASNPDFINNPELSKENNSKLQKAAAEIKWTRWAKSIENSRLNYKIYGCFVKLSEFKDKFPDCTEKDVIKAAFIDVAYKFVNFGCVQRHAEIDRKWDYTILPSQFYFDNVTNLQEQSILEAFQEYPNHYPHIANGFCVGQNLNFITNENYNEDDELIMQFVDMQIYALTRFLSPSRGKNQDEANILINFEEYVYKLPQIQSQALVLPMDELRRISELHYNIVPIFHDIQNRFHRYGWKDKRVATSLSLLADKTYEDFGFEAHINMQTFSGMLKAPDGELFNILNRIPAI
ncbi:hypothetical protein [Vibrio campbellii]|uniref:hypothetical protein n=1 Tax=Vibrio campbellii TaxID=680 RepID=UPI0038CD9A46